MSDPKPIILLTRPQRSSEAFKAELELMLGDVDVVVSPVLQIVDVGPVPDLTPYKTIVLTSQHAVSRLGNAGALQSTSVVTVGEETADLAKKFGAEAIALGRNAEALLEAGRQIVSPCIHCRGVHSRGDIAARLTQAGVLTDEAVIYDQLPIPLSIDAKRALRADRKVIVPVFSPRSAALLSEQVSEARHLVVIAISEATSTAWNGPSIVHVSREPTAHSMLQSVAEAFR